MDKHNYYTLGFLFSRDKTRLALIRKNRPKWQAGFLNGIGGKIEKGEDTVNSLVREFKEETGVEITSREWISKGVMKGDDWSVYIFTAFSDKIDDVQTMEDEEIEVLDVYEVACNRDDILTNLQMLIPLCLIDDIDYNVIQYKR